MLQELSRVTGREQNLQLCMGIGTIHPGYARSAPEYSAVLLLPLFNPNNAFLAAKKSDIALKIWGHFKRIDLNINQLACPDPIHIFLILIILCMSPIFHRP